MRYKSVRQILPFLIFAFSLIIIENVWAAGPFDITIGQDVVFTEGNIKLSSGDASSDGTFAYARVEAGPYTSGKSDAYIGFSLDVLENDEALTSMVAEVTVSYRYSIDVDFLDIVPMQEGGGGSADIQLAVGAIDALYRNPNFVSVPNSYVESDTVSNTTRCVLNAGDTLSYSFDLDAHAEVFKGNYARAYVEVEIIEVKIDFISDLVAVITTIPETPYLGEPITFDSSQSLGENFTQWSWFIDDIPVASTPTMNHTFLQTGTYRIRLRINDQYSQQDTDEKTLSFQPIMTVRPNAANFHTTIYVDETKDTNPPTQAFCIENAAGANADLIISDISFPLGGPFKVLTETCTHAPVAAGDICGVTVIVEDQDKNGASNLQLSHNGNNSPTSIPVLHTVTKLKFARDRELTKEGRKRFKDLWEGQQPTPPVINFYPDINDYRGLEGQQYFFGPPFSPSSFLGSSEDGETALPTIVVFGTELSTATAEDGTIIPYLPYRIYEDGEEKEGGVVLVDFLDLEGGDGWFVSFETGLTDTIGDVVVPVDKFVMFTLHSDPAYGYSITTNLETDAVLEMNLFEGSTNLFDFVSSLVADQDSDSDIDGKDLSSFINNAIQGDPSADLNGDGTIDEKDLAYLAFIFGSSR